MRKLKTVITFILCIILAVVVIWEAVVGLIDLYKESRKEKMRKQITDKYESEIQ
jgi:hypothetical protein